MMDARENKKPKPQAKGACVLSRSVVSDSVDPWTVTPQAPLSMGFPRQEHWSGWPCPPPGSLPNPGIEPEFPALEADALTSEPPSVFLVFSLLGSQRLLGFRKGILEE